MTISRRTLGLSLMIVSSFIMPLLFSVAPKEATGQGAGRPVPTPTPKPGPSPNAPNRSGNPRGTTAPARQRSAVPQIEMVVIPAGSFVMGSPEGAGETNEHPRHRVTVQRFYIGKYEITQAQYRAVMGIKESAFKGDNLPIELVSWDEAKEFCRKLSLMTGRGYRLPSEAEWEYACRAGTSTAFAFGDSLSSDQANFNGKHPFGEAADGIYRRKTVAVGSFEPNRWGLYDMHGNVSEWCEDWYHENYYGAPADGTPWITGGEKRQRVTRGGSWYVEAKNLRSAARDLSTPYLLFTHFGFRIAMAAP
jgi:formylglycine-generating enzyme required for sulfatase activity